jgi:glycosyltransferase involved in cell wall biosynthesis
LDVSIIIPTYQEDEYIKETLVHLARAKSVAALKGVKSEIFVVDSGHDKTFELAKPTADKVFKFRERGVSKARNFGASKASGDILLFMDADVIVPVNLLEEVIRTFKDEAVVAAISRVQPCRFGSHSLSASKRLFYLLDDIFVKNCVNHSFLLRFYNRGDILAIRRDSFFKTSGFNEKLATMEITELIVKLSEVGRIALLKTTVYESVRRLKRWGVLKSYLVWWRYYASYWLLQRPFSSTYETVR